MTVSAETINLLNVAGTWAGALANFAVVVVSLHLATAERRRAAKSRIAAETATRRQARNSVSAMMEALEGGVATFASEPVPQPIARLAAAQVSASAFMLMNTVQSEYLPHGMDADFTRAYAAAADGNSYLQDAAAWAPFHRMDSATLQAHLLQCRDTLKAAIDRFPVG